MYRINKIVQSSDVTSLKLGSVMVLTLLGADCSRKHQFVNFIALVILEYELSNQDCITTIDVNLT